MEVGDARREGSEYKARYFDDVQFVSSRVQHHVHKKTKKGHEPLAACKSKRSKGVCKHDMPKTKLQSLRMGVICWANARKYGLGISGRRNALGSILGRRTCVWQTGTTASFAAFSRSNTHTQPHHLLPPLPQTHESEECKKNCLKAVGMMKAICKIAQRAQREATGYFCGYTFKRQSVGRFEMKATAQCLNYVAEKIKDRRPGQQMHRVTNRVVTDLNQCCTLRPAAEEFNLRANMDNQGVRNVEFIRTFRTASFPGGLF